MRKLLILALLMVLPLVGYSADTEATTVPAEDFKADYMVIWHITADDSGAQSTEDTTWAFPANPHGYDYPMPDIITLKGTFTEVGTNTSTDSTIISIDVARTNATKASTDWAPITYSTGSITYASRTGNSDTLAHGVGDATYSVSYSLTSTQMAELSPYLRIRYDNSDGADAADSSDVDWWVIWQWNHLTDQ